MTEEILTPADLVGEHAGRAMKHLEALYEGLLRMREVNRSTRYELKPYDPAFLETWAAIVVAFRAAEAEMGPWLERAGRLSYDEYVRMLNREFAEARRRNRAVKKGHTVVLVKDIWMSGDAQMESGDPPDIPLGTEVRVVRRGAPPDEERARPGDYVVITVDGTYAMTVPWTIVVPPDLWQDWQRERETTSERS